jgi:hypothetical protein
VKESPPAGLPWPSPQGRTWRVDGVPIPTAQSILNLAVPKGGLGRWGARVAAEFAVAQWDALGKVPPVERQAAIASSPFEERPPAGDSLDELLAAVWEGRPRADPKRVTEDVRPLWRALCSWLDAHQVEPLVWRRAVFDPTRNRRYVAMVDLVARIDQGGPLLVSVETAEHVHPEVRLRLAAARYAPVMVTADGRGTQDWPPVTGCAYLHVRPQGVTLTPVRVGPQERATFRAAHRVSGWLRTNSTTTAR